MKDHNHCLHPPDTIDDVVAWLDQLPAADRERTARILVDRASATAISDARARAVVELVNAEAYGSSWEIVCERLGISRGSLNKLVTKGRASLAARNGDPR